MEGKEVSVHAEGTEDFTLVNINESLVIDAVKEMAGYMDMCKCPKCMSDACAMVLNQMPPQYVTTRKGQLMSMVPHMQTTSQVNVSVLAVKALRLVKESPHH